MDAQARTALSKYLSYVLRHRPDAIGIELDRAGWVDVATLIDRARADGRPFTREELQEVVRTSPKQRFALSEDGLRVRANQGHSTAVDLGYEPSSPPDALFHGTVAKFLPEILERGLQRMGRHHVHLSADVATASSVASRRGKPVILRIAARAMVSAGHRFFRTPNGVWLCDEVPPQFITMVE